MKGYDEWKLATPWDEADEVGTEPGDECGRWQEPDEDCPKSWRCDGTMIEEDGVVYCDTCNGGLT